MTILESLQKVAEGNGIRCPIFHDFDNKKSNKCSGCPIYTGTGKACQERAVDFLTLTPEQLLEIFL